MTFAPSGYPGYIYDVENRLVSVPAYNTPYQTELYAYGPDNKRVWKRMSDGTEALLLRHQRPEDGDLQAFYLQQRIFCD